MSVTVSLKYGKLRLSNHFTEDEISLLSLPSSNVDKSKNLGRADGAQEECKSASDYLFVKHIRKGTYRIN
ncbi:uncharacterized protein RAG0_10747 [Rhynchosporium agropyri]|uniref:Uncharacterized protein n=1 Tax=Rhynchosporium agropyri TaxID=914238 RepID=A0A1E1L100_9HELO|nr:uncharacterized protein RAG0_10747 [Rhynchosporium agropyri]